MALQHLRLAGVNEVLRLLGFNTVTSLGESKESTIAEQRMNAAGRELQDRAWWFNLDPLVALPLSHFGWAHLPTDTSLPDETRRTVKAVERLGRRLYDRVNKTFVWGTPTNFVSEPIDLDQAPWVASNLTVDATNETVEPPGGVGVRNVRLLKNTSAAGTLTHLIALANFVDGGVYEVSGYFRRSSTVESTTCALRFDSVAANTLARSRWNSKTGLPINITHNAEEGDVIFVDGGSASSSSRDWMYVTFRRTWNTADGDMNLIIVPDELLTTGELYATGLSVQKVGNVATPKLDLIRSYPFEELPNTARTYVTRRAAVEALDLLNGTTARRRQLFAREIEALADLNRADAGQAKGNMLTSSRGVASTVGRNRRLSVLDSLPTPGLQ